MISSGFTKEGAALIFILAYHLKTPSSDYVFNEDLTQLESIEDKKYSDFSKGFMSAPGPTIHITSPNDDKKEAAIYSYIAASLLRLFTKPPSNYVKAWPHILSGFQKFYSADLGIQLPTPTEGAVKGLADWFSADSRARVTLYRLLWISNGSQEDQGLQRFLYDMHISNTGMHLANMFNQLCKVKNCKPGVILSIINTPEYTKQTACLVKLLTLMKSTADQHSRKMWKYGRLFDETFMADIKTKSCTKLVWIFASALKLVAPNSYKGVHNIAQLADVSDVNRKKCDAVAQQLIKKIQQTQVDDGFPSQ